MAAVDLRVVSYNVHGLRDDRAALAAVVRALAPDVLLLQEAPRRFRWRHRCAQLAQAFGLVVAVGGMPAVGNLILTDLRVRVERTWCVRFPLKAGRHLRGAALAHCAVAGVPFVAVGSHLATDPAERPGQARMLAAGLAGLDPPVVLGADLNDRPGGPAWQALADGRAGALVDTAEAAGAADTPTYPCADPQLRIDAVLADHRLEVVSCRVADTPQARRASDHLPVVADLRLST